MWHRRMTTTAMNGNLKMVSRCHTGAIMHSNLTHCETRPIMHAPNCVHREACEQAIFNHCLTTSAAFFSRLKNEIDRAIELACLAEITGSAEQHRHMTIMPAAMHTPLGQRLMRKLIRLNHRQAIHISAQTNSRPLIRLAL